MDIFLLSPVATNTAESGTWASPAGVKALIPLVELAGPKPKRARVFTVFSAHESSETTTAMIEALRTLRVSSEAEIRVVVPMAAVREELLERLRDAGLVDVAFYCAAAEPAPESAIQTAATFSGKHPATRFRWRLWLEPARSSANLARVSLLQSAGLPFETVEVDAFFPPYPIPREAMESAPFLDFAVGTCSLYEGTLTFNGLGQVVPCPRMSLGPDASASLVAHSPQALLQCKGGQARLVGRCEACLGCRARARFEWPSSHSQALTEWMAEGKRQAEADLRTGVARPFGSSRNEIEDLGTLTPEQQREELEKFEAQLEEWSAGMGGREDGQPRASSPA